MSGGGILVLILAGAISIITSVIKNKQQRNQNHHTPFDTGDAEDPWESIMKEIQSKRRIEPQPVMDEAFESPYEEVFVKEEPVKETPSQETRVNPYNVRKGKETSARHSNKRTDQTEPVVTMADNGFDPVDFNLRDAVIFSEILKPKFEE